SFGPNIWKSALDPMLKSLQNPSLCLPLDAVQPLAFSPFHNGTTPNPKSYWLSLQMDALLARHSAMTSIYGTLKDVRLFCSARQRITTHPALLVLSFACLMVISPWTCCES